MTLSCKSSINADVAILSFSPEQESLPAFSCHLTLTWHQGVLLGFKLQGTFPQQSEEGFQENEQFLLDPPETVWMHPIFSFSE